MYAVLFFGGSEVRLARHALISSLVWRGRSSLPSLFPRLRMHVSLVFLFPVSFFFVSIAYRCFPTLAYACINGLAYFSHLLFFIFLYFPCNVTHRLVRLSVCVQDFNFLEDAMRCVDGGRRELARR